MALALLTIGTATSRINLLDDRGFHLGDWRPVAADHSASFAESALADGRQPVASRDLNAIETMGLILRASGADDAAIHVQGLRRMLRAAVKYWVSLDPSLVPVYLEARSDCETNTRYALVYDGRLPEDDNYYNQPFKQSAGHAVMDKLTLVLERGPWTENAPGTGTCVQVSGVQPWPLTQTTDTASPAASADDVCNYQGELGLNASSVSLPLGYDTNTRATVGIRFTGVAVPQGADIVSAYVTFEADATIDLDTVRVLIYGQDSDDAATFSDYADFASRTTRPPTTATMMWLKIPHWTDTQAYNSPSLVNIVQEIVNRPGWVSGNDIVIFFKDHGSDNGAYRLACSWDHLTGAAPILTVTYYTPVDFGRSATCDNEVYVANKHNQAQLTHIFVDDGGVFGANLIGGALPYDLFPAAPADNDAIYFGIQSGLADAGPFSSLVFNIRTVAAYVGAAHIDWQYSQGGGVWGALTVRDNTGNSGLQSFSVAGVNSVHWAQPSNWATDTVNAVVAYWVRAVCDIGVGESISTPSQESRDVYTIVRPSVDIDAAQVGGDMPALARLKIENQSSGNYGANPALYSTRIIASLRSTDRGADFTPFINLSEEQNPAGIAVTAGASTTIAASMLAPTGWAAYYNNVAGAAEALTNRVTVTIANTVAAQWYGRYRAFVRGWQVTGGTVGNVGIRLVTINGGAAVYSPTVYFTVLNAYQALDMGILTIPSGALALSDIGYGDLTIYIQASSAGNSDDCYLTDLILMPIDEWSADFVRPAYDSTAGYNGLPGLTSWRTLLDVDSITYPKHNLRAILRYVSTGEPTFSWEPRCPGPALLLNGKDQKLWLLSMRNVTTGIIWYAEPEIAHSIQVWRQQRYDTLRGAG